MFVGVKWPGAFILVLAFLLFGLYTGSQGTILIADEVAYFEHALSISSGNLSYPMWFENLGPSRYPVGTSLILSVLYLVGGKIGGFLLGPISIGISVFSLHKIISHKKWKEYSLYILFLFPPLLVMQNRLMSDLPSFAIFSFFLYLLFQKNEYKFLIGLVAGLSILFRETNVILVLPFLIEDFVGNSRRKYSLVVGFLLGIMIRSFSSRLFYGAWFFAKDSGVDFSGVLLFQNLLLYGGLLMVFVPFGYAAIFKYTGKFKKSFVVSALVFSLIYLLYDYNGYSASGVKSLILGGRFFIPFLPLVVLSIAQTDFYSQGILKGLGVHVWKFAFLAVIASFLLLFETNREQEKIVDIFYKNKGLGVHFFQADSESLKCLSHLYGRHDKYFRFSNLEDVKENVGPYYFHSFDNSFESQFDEKGIEYTVDASFKSRIRDFRISTLILDK